MGKHGLFWCVLCPVLVFLDITICDYNPDELDPRLCKKTLPKNCIDGTDGTVGYYYNHDNNSCDEVKSCGVSPPFTAKETCNWVCDVSYKCCDAPPDRCRGDNPGFQGSYFDHGSLKCTPIEICQNKTINVFFNMTECRRVCQHVERSNRDLKN
ncbi:uncharacterized protein LOC135398204 [Ornithodoros turicata]|uniref:uncharacterized protein LOC135398204 n=1 Tax=Ornithodoros turicata TaxID=34597 RepID=UPI003138FB44